MLKRLGVHRRWVVFLVQATLLTLANILAFLIRFDGMFADEVSAVCFRALPVLMALRIAGFIPFGLFAGLWRYVSVKDLRNIIGSVALSSAAFFLCVRATAVAPGYPGSVIVIDALLLVFGLSGIRMVKRVLRALGGRNAVDARVLILGAGDAGEMLLREIEMHGGYRYRAIGFIDDDPQKTGARIRGVRVLGTRRDLARIVADRRPDELIVTISSAPVEVLQEIVRDAKRFGLPVKIVPGLRDLLSTRRILDSIRQVEPEDLLSRPSVSFVSQELRDYYRGQRLMVTGAGGSIGSELVRQLASLEPGSLVLYERHEHSLYQIELEIRRTRPACAIVPVIGDILDAARLSAVLATHRPAVLFHAAAYKHVPMMEQNPQEAVKVNVLGTKRVAQLAVRHGVDRLVFISSDKAVRPSNVMGATKRVGELILQDFVKETTTKFMAVRFGNVLESSGSVVPLFKDQIRRGGPVTITHPEITRYFMTTAEAVHLVLNAALLGRGGEIFVLDMGQPVKVLDMARQLIAMHGYEPGKDIEIVFTGLRPGEKLHESLFNESEEVRRTSHPKIFKVMERRLKDRSALPDHFPAIMEMVLSADGGSELKERLAAVVETA